MAERWNSAAAGHRARNRLKRNPAVRWSDLVGPLLSICSCPLFAISDNRSRTRTITTDFTDGTDKIIRVIREIRGQKSGRSAPPNARPEWRGAEGVEMQTGLSIPRPLQADSWTS